ncbi:MAG: hypothetical protein HYT79_00395 [Elusimicrobia bacterium]|nr:hypothetical protein [Elusimicrobiota bacterium]
MNAKVFVAAFFLALIVSFSVSAEDKTTDWVKPCDGYGRDNLMHYCCKKSKTIPITFFSGLMSTGYVGQFLSQANQILEDHAVRLADAMAPVDPIHFPAYEDESGNRIDNFAKLCRAVNSVLLEGSLGVLGRGFRGRLAVVFMPYATDIRRGPDSNGMFINDLHESCREAVEAEFGEDEAGEILPATVVIVNAYELEERTCFETLAHEVGHAVGLGHEGGRLSQANIMNACQGGVDRDELNQTQVKKFCQARRFNTNPNLPPY